MDQRRDTIVIGSSAGGVKALRRLLSALPADLPATVLVVQHQGGGAGRLAEALAHGSALGVDFARDGETLRRSRAYLAPPDRHLLVDGDRAVVTAGPRENRSRPAIDPLFRSAAATRGSRTVAVQLTGMLADGVAGLAAVRRCGGLVVVQDPDDAEFDAMPRNALSAVGADHVATLDALPGLLTRLVDEVAPVAEVPDDIALEARLSLPGPSRPSGVERVGHPVALSCPDCGGPLWQTGEGDTATYRCHVGHALSTRVLLDAQSQSIERSLWVAVRSLSEHAATLHRLADSTGGRGAARGDMADAFRERADEALAHSDEARRFLLSLHERMSDLDAGSTVTASPGSEAANEGDVHRDRSASVPEGE